MDFTEISFKLTTELSLSVSSMKGHKKEIQDQLNADMFLGGINTEILQDMKAEAENLICMLYQGYYSAGIKNVLWEKEF